MLNLFRHRFIQVVVLSELCMLIGMWIRNFAVLLYVVEMTNGDAFAVAMISVAEFAPIFIFSFIGGVFADRWRPRRTMIWSDILSAVSILGVLCALLIGSWKAIFLTTLVSAILSQFSQPAFLKLFQVHLPKEQIQAGMSIHQTIFATFMVFGPVLGTFVYQTFGIYVSVVVMVISFILSAAVLLLLPPDRDMEDREDGRHTVIHEMIAGIRYVWSKRILRLLGGCFLVVGLGLGLIQPFFIFLVTEQLGLPKDYLQWLMMANGLGMILGGIIAMGLAKRITPQKLLMLGILFNAIGISVSGISTVMWLTLIFQFVSGLAMPGIHIGINTIILQHVEDAYVGRVNGILTPLFSGAVLLTMSISGELKGFLSLTVLYEIAAFFFIVGLLVILPLYRMAPVVSMKKNAEQVPVK